MVIAWVSVSPMNNPTFLIPFIFTVKLHKIAFFQTLNPRRQVNIVCDQNGLTRTQPNKNSLMTTALIVIRQQPYYDTPALNLNVAFAIIVGFGKNMIIGKRRA